MKHGIFKKISAITLGVAMALGVGVAVSSLSRGVVKESRADDISAITTIKNYASANSWVDATFYETVSLDSEITLTASSNNGSNTGKYYKSDYSWRFYANESAKLVISSKTATLKSVTVTFSIKDDGIVKNGTSSVTSGTATSISGTSAELTISQSSGNKGKIFFTAISVTYGSTKEVVNKAITGPSDQSLKVGDTDFDVASYVKVDGSAITNYTVSSDDGTVATILDDTKVHAVGRGTATITISKDDIETDTQIIKYASATFEVTVTADPIYVVTGNTIDFSTLFLENSVQYKAQTFTADDYTVTFTGGTNCAKYYDDGTALRFYGSDKFIVSAKGTNVIGKIEFVFGSTSSKTFSANVGNYSNGTWTGSNTSVSFTSPGNHVGVKEVTVTLAKEMTITSEVTSVELGQNITITASQSGVTWSSSDGTVASINATTGVVTGLKLGTTTITAKKAEYLDASVEITVTPLTSPFIALEVDSIVGYDGDTFEINGTYGNFPEQTVPTVQYTNKGNLENVTELIEDGIIMISGKLKTASTNTSLTVSGSTAESQTVSFTINQSAITSFSLDKASLNMEVDDEATITATVEKVGNISTDVEWGSSNEDVAYVVDGTVLATGVGTATITASTVDGQERTCSVNVKKYQATYVFSDHYDANTQLKDVDINLYIDSKNVNQKVVLRFGQGKNGSNAPMYNTDGKAARFYQKNTLTITSTKSNITSFTLVFAASDSGTTTFSANKGTITGGVWVGSATNSITLTGSDDGSQRRIAAIKINFYDADAFANDLLSTLECDVSGTNAPSTSVWSTLSGKAGTLFDSELEKLTYADYTKTGEGEETVVVAKQGTSQLHAEAVAKYDFVIQKYLIGKGITAYNDFLTREDLLESRFVPVSKENCNNTALIIAVISIVSVSALAAFLLFKKKKEQ